jgi:hypothetical protein
MSLPISFLSRHIKLNVFGHAGLPSPPDTSISFRADCEVTDTKLPSKPFCSSYPQATSTPIDTLNQRLFKTPEFCSIFNMEITDPGLGMFSLLSASSELPEFDSTVQHNTWNENEDI